MITDPRQDKDAVGSESTTLPTYVSNKAWKADFEFGRGYDLVADQLKTSALPANLTIIKSQAASAQTFRSLIKDQASFDKEVSASVSGSGTADGVTLTGSAQFLGRVQFSSLSSTLVASWVQVYSSFDNVSSPTLTEAASAQVGQKEFKINYGNYYISGGRRQAEFTAVYVFSATTANDLETFNAAIGASAQDVFSAKASLDLQSKASSSNVAITTYIVCSPATGNPPVATKTDGSVNAGDVMSYLEWFQANAEDGYLIAELALYNTIDTRISPVVAISPEFWVDLRNLSGSLIRATQMYNSLPRAIQSTFEQDLNGLQTRMETSRPSFEHHPELMTTVQAAATTLINEIAPFLDYFSLLAEYAGNDGGAASVMPHGGNAGIGWKGDKTPSPGSLVVQPVTLSCNKPWASGNVTGQCAWHVEGARIISVDIASGYGSNQGSVVHYAGGLGQDNITVGFESDFDHGIDWNVFLQFVMCD